MSDIVVRTVGLGKMYHIGGERESYRTLRSTIANAVKRPVERLRHPGAATHVSATIWAVKDVNLELSRGQVLGIIGRNGSGKSTLLKILSRITEPTEGRAEIRGRVGSLLEVGTGFHSELTGRENIRLNGAILGMTRAEIQRKFDEIVEFSEISRFLDTPVKRYSSGMYVRLAFAVAAHLEPEIMLVDEVLAVGDQRFQEKCLGKIEDIAQAGRTVIFVSHNMASVLSLCNRCILLENGHLVADGPPSEVTHRYHVSTALNVNRFVAPPDHARRGDGRVRIDDFRTTPTPLRTGEPAELAFRLGKAEWAAASVDVELAVAVLSEQGVPLLHLYSKHMGQSFKIDGPRAAVVMSVPNFPLAPGNYRLNLWVGSGDNPIDWLLDCMTIDVAAGQLAGAAYVQGHGYPVVVPSCWTREE